MTAPTGREQALLKAAIKVKLTHGRRRLTVESIADRAQALAGLKQIIDGLYEPDVLEPTIKEVQGELRA